MGFAAALAVAVGLGWLAPATHAQARVDISLTDSVTERPGPDAASDVDVAAVASQRTVDFTYSVELENVPENASLVKAWIPIPWTNQYQIVREIEVETDGVYEFLQEEEHENRYVLIDFSDLEPGEKAAFTLSFRATRRTRTTDWSTRGAGALDEEWASFLRPSKLLRLDGPVATEAREVIGDSVDPLERASRIYEHIVDTVKYDKSGAGWGRGDSLYACDARAGNCTDFHSLFIGQARSLGIPSRFIMGFGLPKDAREGELAGYHCWAEFYVEGLGWIPVDASEAHKNPEMRSFLFGNLDSNRVQFTTGRDIRIPEAEAGPVNFSIYPHVEIDGKIHTGVKTVFSYQGN
jgi:transglutaminase-like putative cysteine protease